MTFILPLPKATDLFIIYFYFSHSSYHCQVKSALVLMQIVRKKYVAKCMEKSIDTQTQHIQTFLHLSKLIEFVF